MNWLQPPFNDVKVRRAAAYALSQPEFLEANIGDKRFYRVCKAMFTCGTPLASTVGMEGLIEGNYRQGQGAAGRGQVRRRAGRDPAADRPRRDQAARAGRQGAAREGGLQGRGPADGLAEHGDPPQHQEGPAVGRRLERLRHELGAARHPRSADDAEPGRDLREGARRLAVRRRRWRSCATTSSRAVTPAEKKAAADAVQNYAMQVVTHVPLGEWFGVVRRCAATSRSPRRCAAGHGVLGHHEEVESCRTAGSCSSERATPVALRS